MNPTERLADLGRRIADGTLGTDADSVAPEVHAEFAALSRACRAGLARTIDAQLGPFDPLHLEALREVPRERFVRPGDQDRSAEDVPLPLDDEGLATISAPHAYLLSFRLLDLSPGDRLVELGSGSGYGAALGAYIVGPGGRVVTLEIDGVFTRAPTRSSPIGRTSPCSTPTRSGARTSGGTGTGSCARSRWSGSPKSGSPRSRTAGCSSRPWPHATGTSSSRASCAGGRSS